MTPSRQVVPELRTCNNASIISLLRIITSTIILFGSMGSIIAVSWMPLMNPTTDGLQYAVVGIAGAVFGIMIGFGIMVCNPSKTEAVP